MSSINNRRDFLRWAGLAALGASIPGCRRGESPVLESFVSNGDPLHAYPYRGWEDLYRKQWTWDKVVRSTHSANCTAEPTPPAVARRWPTGGSSVSAY